MRPISLINRLFARRTGPADATSTSGEDPWLTSELEGALSDEIADTLRSQRRDSVPNGLYETTVVKFVFNHERIEGSTLTEWQTQEIFETRGLVLQSDATSVEKREAANHTLMFDELLDTLDEPLSTALILRLHRRLMDGVMECPGEWRTLPNAVSSVMTCPPHEVPAAMEALTDAYGRYRPTLENIARFHLRFETIHPFADGNGRVGRAIAFRECLRGRLVPFFVTDETKGSYYEALAGAQGEPGTEGLVTYFRGMQRAYLSLANVLLPPNEALNMLRAELALKQPDFSHAPEFSGEAVADPMPDAGRNGSLERTGTGGPAPAKMRDGEIGERGTR